MGSRRRNERGPITQRAASAAIEPMPRSVARSAHPSSSSRRHAWLRHAVHTSVSERTRSGYVTAMIWAFAPPIDAPIRGAESTPWSSSTLIASVAICSRL